jgi:hypothetical protein
MHKYLIWFLLLLYFVGIYYDYSHCYLQCIKYDNNREKLINCIDTCMRVKRGDKFIYN